MRRGILRKNRVGGYRVERFPAGSWRRRYPREWESQEEMAATVVRLIECVGGTRWKRGGGDTEAGWDRRVP